MKEEALKLADEFDEMTDPFQSLAYAHKAQAMIRRLVEELDYQNIIKDSLRQQLAEKLEELDKPHKYDPETGEPLIDGYPLFSGLPRGKPLSDEEILNSWVEIDLPQECWITDEHLINFARAIEERHGIK